MYEQLVERIFEFGNKFRGRLPNDILDYDLEYIEHNEWGLAFETICDHLADYDVVISQDEYDEMLNIATVMGHDSSIERRFTYLEQLIK